MLGQWFVHFVKMQTAVCWFISIIIPLFLNFCCILIFLLLCFGSLHYSILKFFRYSIHSRRFYSHFIINIYLERYIFFSVHLLHHLINYYVLYLYACYFLKRFYYSFPLCKLIWYFEFSCDLFLQNSIFPF